MKYATEDSQYPAQQMDAVPESPWITDGLGRLESLMSDLGETLGKLGSKMEPVLTPQSPHALGTDETSARPATSQVAQRIDGLAVRTSELIETARSLTRRLEVAS